MQSIHPEHFLQSITGKLFTISIAPLGQFLAQSPHPIQPTEQAFITSFPRQRLLHATKTFADLGIKSIRCLGQLLAQSPQASQSALFVLAIPASVSARSTAKAPKIASLFATAKIYLRVATIVSDVRKFIHAVITAAALNHCKLFFFVYCFHS